MSTIATDCGTGPSITCQRGGFFCQPLQPGVSGPTVAFVVGEDAQGGTHLNGDEDTFDDVLSVYDVREDRLIETSLAAAHGTGRDVSSFRFVYPPAVLEDTVVFLVHEAAQGETDLNGDGRGRPESKAYTLFSDDRCPRP